MGRIGEWDEFFLGREKNIIIEKSLTKQHLSEEVATEWRIVFVVALVTILVYDSRVGSTQISM